MQCPTCGKTERVVIGTKQYCASCGRALDTAPAEATAPQKVFSDLSSVTSPPVVNPNVTPAPVVAPIMTPAAAPTTPPPTTADVTVKPMTDLTPRQPVVAAAPTSELNPAKSFHARQTTTSPVLDLRGVTPTPAVPAPTSQPLVTQPAPVEAVTLSITNKIAQDPYLTPVGTDQSGSEPTTPKPDITPPLPKVPSVTVTPSAPKPLPEIRPLHPAAAIPKPSGNPVPPTFTPNSSTILAANTSRKEARQSNAETVTQSAAIAKFTTNPVSVLDNAPEPAPALTAPVAATTPKTTNPLDNLTPTSNLNSKLNALDNDQAATVTAPTVAGPQLPNAVVTQVNSLAKAIATPAAPAKVSHDDALKLAMNTDVKPNFRPASVAAAIAVVTVMAGYIWVNNYPKMTIKSAAGKAGVEASVPGFMPSSYSLSGPVAYSPGEVTLNFANQNHGENVQITQRRTVWDSGSLLDNYVAKASNQYLAVQGQGLTIYLFGDNRASWVNHGIWYNIQGTNSLTRDQLLKIAYSL